MKVSKKLMQNRFNVNDRIQQLRYDDVIRDGKVVAGPFNVEGVSHYHVKWGWECPDHASTPDFLKTANEPQLICDMVSTKYMYR